MVSVIMGVYNASEEKMLCKSIESVLNQTHHDLELIMCDDGSNDNTYEILEKFSKKDSRIVLLKNKHNQGLAFTLNKCIQASRGDILVRNDIDDYSDINRIEEQVSFLRSHPEYSIIGSNTRLFDDNGIWGEMNYPEQPQKKDFLFCLPFTHGAIAMNKDAVLRVGGYKVSKETRRTEDFELFSRMYAHGYIGYNLQQPLYYYKEDENAQSKRIYKYRIDEFIVKFKAYKMLGLMPQGILYAIKPIIVGLIPTKLLNFLKDKYYKRRLNS